MPGRKKLGIISGMGTKAGMLFLNKLIDRIDAPTDQDYPEFVVHNNSRIPDRTRAIVYKEASPMAELERSVNMLADANVDYILATCVTSYHFLRQLEVRNGCKIIDPIALITERLINEYPYIQRIGLLATSGTIDSRLFHNAFRSLPFELITLDRETEENTFMKAVYMDGGFKSSTIDDVAYGLFAEAVDVLVQKDAQLILGGCTEAQIGFGKVDPGVPYLDVVDVLIDEVVNLMTLKTKIELE
jgi:aspartate racemase